MHIITCFFKRRGVSFTETSLFIFNENGIMANPIWKDYYVSLGTADSISYRIRVNNTTIYTGKAFKRPGQSDNQIRINDICADFISNTLPAMSESAFSALSFPVEFIIQILSGSTWSTLTTVQFDNNWSYDYDYNPETMGMAFPINGHIDLRQWLVFSAYNASSITATITLKDGSSFDVIIAVAISADFNSDFNSDFARAVRSAQSGTAVFDLTSYGDVDSVTIGNTKYKVVTDCRKYALYYSNAYGGWDTFLIEGNIVELDNLTRLVREMEYDNRSIQNRGFRNYVNTIQKTFNLHTSWLSDDEASRMHHLMNSTNVYLYDINAGEMIPVIVNNSTTEYKTYKGNGGKLVNYEINVSVAHDRIRR